MLTKKGKLTFASLLLSSMLITTTYATEQNVSDVDKTDETILRITKTFPETLQVLMDTPGRYSDLIIPMSKNEYESNILYELKKDSKPQKENIKGSFMNVSYVGDLALVKFNTEVKDTFVDIKDKSTGFRFSYSFGGGYVYSTTIYKLFNEDDKETSAHLDYLSNQFETYLLRRGFVKNSSWLDTFSNTKEYKLDNYIVTIKTPNDFMDRSFSVTMKNKKIEENLKHITRMNKIVNMKYEYKSLNKILN